MSQSASLDLKLHPKQGVALTTEATEVLYGGSAGGGKSHLMRAAAIMWFSILWDKLNKKCGYSWTSNPYVWVIEFSKVKS